MIRVVSELARQTYECAFIDDGVETGTEICGISVIGHTADLQELFAEYKNLIIVIGNNAVRERMGCPMNIIVSTYRYQ